MTTTTAPAAIEASVPPVIRYRNQGGATVRVIEVKRENSNPDTWDYKFVGQCAGCLDTEGSTAYPKDIDRARTWAAQHAATCHALPPVTTEAQSISETYLAEAHRLIEAAREARLRPAERERAELLVTVANSMVGFARAAHQIEGAGA
jgi:hypothetical protein